MFKCQLLTSGTFGARYGMSIETGNAKKKSAPEALALRARSTRRTDREVCSIGILTNPFAEDIESFSLVNPRCQESDVGPMVA